MFVSAQNFWAATVRTLTADPSAERRQEGAVLSLISAAGAGTFGAYQTVVASLTSNACALHIVLTQAVPKAGRIQVAVGGVGSEVPIVTLFFPAPTVGVPMTLGDVLLSAVDFPAASRVSARVVNDTDGVADTIVAAITVGESS
jgi:hypothetical protein